MQPDFAKFGGYVLVLVTFEEGYGDPPWRLGVVERFARIMDPWGMADRKRLSIASGAGVRALMMERREPHTYLEVRVGPHEYLPANAYGRLLSAPAWNAGGYPNTVAARKYVEPNTGRDYTHRVMAHECGHWICDRLAEPGMPSPQPYPAHDDPVKYPDSVMGNLTQRDSDPTWPKYRLDEGSTNLVLFARRWGEK